jgi:holo-[acyl-carrier protein] synthase
VARRGQPPALAQVDLRDVEVVDDGFGRPGLRLHGPVRAAVAELAPGATVTAHVSISHDGPTAAAVVILEA